MLDNSYITYGKPKISQDEIDEVNEVLKSTWLGTGKKAQLFESNFSTESRLLDTAKPILNSDSLWKPYTLLLLGDYFTFKKRKMY